MIFITVGTHEQPFDRLLEEIDSLIDRRVIKEDVFAQIGYSKYRPRNYSYETLIGYERMDSLVRDASVIITHGGPGSIFHPIQYGKIPVVVPRNPEFNEHVDNHQILFTKRLEEEKKVVGVYDIENLGDILSRYYDLAKLCLIGTNSRDVFVNNFSKLIRDKLKLEG